MRLSKLKILFLKKIRSISCKFLFYSGKNIIENLRTSFSDFCGNDSFLLSILNLVQISQDSYVERKVISWGTKIKLLQITE